MTVKIGGVDIAPYIAFQGFKWQRNDVESSDAGRTLDGSMQRNRVATKVRLDITCRPLLGPEAATVLTAIMPVFVTVQYYDPQLGAVTTKTMYSNNNPASFLIKRKNGQEYWAGITFPLSEK